MSEDKDKRLTDLSNILPAIIAFVALTCVLLTYMVYRIAADRGIHGGNSGTLGDTIGGTSGPIIGLLSAILVYISFRAQIRANEITREESIKAMDVAREESNKAIEVAREESNKAIEVAREESNFRYLNEEFEQLLKKIDEYTFGKSLIDTTRGNAALNEFSKGIPELWDESDGIKDNHLHYLKSTRYLLKSMQNTFSNVNELKLSRDLRLVIRAKMNIYYKEYLEESLRNIENWQVTPDFQQKHDLNKISFEINATVSPIIGYFTLRNEEI